MRRLSIGVILCFEVGRGLGSRVECVRIDGIDYIVRTRTTLIESICRTWSDGEGTEYLYRLDLYISD